MAKSSDVLQAPPTDAVRLGGLETSIGLHLRLAQLRAYDRFFDAFQGVDLRPGEYSVLWLIHQNPGVRQGQLAERLEIKAAQMTKMIRRFEDQGHVRRAIPDEDRRAVCLFLTEGGSAFTLRHRAAFFGHDTHHYHGLSEAEVGQLIQLLTKYTTTTKGTGQ